MEIWSGSPPDLSHLRVFGCSVLVDQRDGKLDSRFKKGVFLGYSSGVKGYKVCLRNEPRLRVVISRDVIFNKFEMPYLKPDSDPINTTN